jgi:RluA family pseudouridine synthase
MFVSKNEEKSLLDNLKITFPDSSKRTLLIWIKNGRVLVDNKEIKNKDFIVKKDQIISLKSKAKEIPANIKIIYEDPYFLIIDKPHNLLSVPKDTPGSISALKILRKYFNSTDIFAVHRIDRATSGLLVFAKSTTSLDKLKELFKKHDITRKYLAVVKGDFKEDEGSITNYLIENENLKVSITSEEKGKIAITDFKTIYRNKTFSFLALSLQTGRKHQIRVQLANLGFPVFGDKKYGIDNMFAKRMYLHAFLLDFIHPFTDKKMHFASRIPEEFSAIGADKIRNIL